MKNVIAILGILLFALSVHAQEDKQDVVYLKNGSIIRGTMKPSQKEGTTSIETVDHNVWVFQQDQIDSVRKEEFPKKNINFDPDGWYTSASLMLLPGRDDHSILLDVGVKQTVGYQWDGINAIGLNIGLVSFGEGLVYSALEYRRYLKKSRTAPYIVGSAGYSSPFHFRSFGRQNYGGVNGGLGFGLRHYFTDNAAIDMSLGLQYQRTTEKFDDWWWGTGTTQHTLINHHNRIGLNIGILFN